MSESFRQFITFAADTAAGDWAWVTLSWLLTVVGLGLYWFHLTRIRRRLEREVAGSTGS